MRLLSICLLVVAMGCDATSNYSAPADDAGYANGIAEKASRSTYTVEYDLSEEEPWIECRGELMAFYGILKIHITEVETPSGNLLVRGWIEYPPDGYAVGTQSGIEWTRKKGLNPYTETLKGDWYGGEDFWSQNWQIIEWYTNDEHGQFKLQWWGGFRMDDDGTLVVNRDNLTCR